jgi:endonuclease/exonuclease/phosphatase family metal-dependent hydrolase
MSYALTTGQFLRAGDYLTAINSSCFAIMQRDGNFCIYAGADPEHNRGSIWASLSRSERDGDYFAIMQRNGNFAVYEGTPEHPGNCIWATDTSAEGGEFVAALEPRGNFTISTGSAAKPGRLLWAARHRLRVMTFNTHLMEGSNIVVGAFLTRQLPVTFRDEERHDFIVKKILDCGADIVALQEVWSGARMDRIERQLKPRYPYSIRGTSGEFYEAGSGILLASKYPFGENWGFMRFKNPSGDDRFAAKGVLWAPVELEDGVTLLVGMTHACVDAGGDECTNIKDLIDKTLNQAGCMGVLMGDFNIHRRGAREKFDILTNLMAGVGATDSWSAVHGPDAGDASATDDQIHNNLTQFFSPNRNTPEPDCIDYVYLRNTLSHILRPIGAEVVRTWQCPLGETGRAWYWVHEGTVGGLPSGAVFRDKMCVAVRRQDGKLSVAVIDQVDERWRHATIRDVTTEGSPGVVWFADRLCLFFRRGKQVYKMESEDGLAWSGMDPQGVDFQSSGGVCPVVFRDSLYVFVKDPEGLPICYHVWRNGAWSGRQVVGIDTRWDIAAAVLDDKLCIVSVENGAVGSTARLVGAILDGSGKWSLIHPAETKASGSPGITVHDGQFHVFYRDSGGTGILTRSSRDGKVWSSEPSYTHHDTENEVCPIVWKGRLMLFYSFLGKRIEFDRLMYSNQALTHGYYPAGVDLDASDHYPYQVEFVWA